MRDTAFLLVCLMTLYHQPRVFESFVEVLFDIISHVNSPGDRILRATVPTPPS